MELCTATFQTTECEAENNGVGHTVHGNGKGLGHVIGRGKGHAGCITFFYLQTQKLCNVPQYAMDITSVAEQKSKWFNLSKMLVIHGNYTIAIEADIWCDVL
jgi:hypothetical protein